MRYVETEKSVLAQAKHPNILNLISTFQTKHSFVFVTNYVDGGNLSQHLEKHRRFSLNDTRKLCAEILLGLEYLHQKDVIYGDLNPQNILLTSQRHIVLADFGLSWRKGQPINYRATPEYSSPEQMLGKHTCKPLDFWMFVV